MAFTSYNLTEIVETSPSVDFDTKVAYCDGLNWGAPIDEKYFWSYKGAGSGIDSSYGRTCNNLNYCPSMITKTELDRSIKGDRICRENNIAIIPPLTFTTKEIGLTSDSLLTKGYHSKLQGAQSIHAALPAAERIFQKNLDEKWLKIYNTQSK